MGARRIRPSWALWLTLAVLLLPRPSSVSSAEQQASILERAQRAALGYTETQANDGRWSYRQHCASCHGTDLRGAFEAPPLAGPNFMNVWAARSVRQLLDLSRTTMPPDRPGSLREATYTDIVAYLLQANGIIAGEREYVVSTDAIIGGGPAPGGSAEPTAGLIAEDPAGPRSTGETELRHEIDSFIPVSEAMLLRPNAADWPMYRRTYDGSGYSPLKQIHTDNVDQLRLSWAWAMEPGVNQPTPLVYDGVMYLTNPGNVVQALDAASGDLLWEFRRRFADDFATGGFDQMRNVAIYDDKIFLATKDAYLVALDARNGSLVWETRIADYHQGYTNVSGPIVVRGKVINGINGCQRFYEESCFITAHDARTGEELWRTFTIARPGEVGGDTWGELPWELRGGADVWITGSYDPQLDLTFWGTAQAKPWVAASRGLTVADSSLYTNSTLALDPDDGNIVWYYQHVPGETLDLDEAFEKVLIDVDGRRTLFTIGKHGILWRLDGKTGAFLGLKETVFQTSSSTLTPRPANSATVRTSPRPRSENGSRSARAPRAVTIGRRWHTAPRPGL